MPDSVIPNYPPFWTKNEYSGELSGFFVDIMKEIFRHTNMTYTMVDNANLTSYDSLGKNKAFIHPSNLFYPFDPF